MWQLLYGGLLFIGLTLSSFALWHYQKTKKLLSDGIKTTAIVVDLLESTDNDGDTVYMPVFEFTDRSLEVVRFKSEISSRPASHKIGQKVKVVYDPSDTTEVKVVSFWGLYRWAIILFCIASPLLIIGGGYFLYDWG
jgi:hypothetical protein